MATKVTVQLKKETRQVTFEGGASGLLQAIVSSFKALTSVDDIDQLLVYDKDEDDFIRLPFDKVRNGSRLKVVPKKKGSAETVKTIGSSDGDASVLNYEKVNTRSFELVMEMRADSLFESPSTMTLSKKIEQLSESECQERIKHHQEKSQRLLEAAQRISVCFLLDCTGSMSPWVAQIKDSIQTWKRRLSENYQYAQLHFSFVRYTDFDQPTDTRTTFLNFTQNPEEFSSFIDQIQMTGGGDTAEDILGGLKVALEKLNWSLNNATKVLMHIADAPCHGRQYHNADIDDNYPDEDYSHDLKDLFELMHKKQIRYYFAYIKKEHTDKMIAEFNSILYKITGESAYITQLDATSPDSVDKIVFNSLEESITKTLGHFAHEPKVLLELDPNVPKWSDVPPERGLITLPVDKKLTEENIRLCLPSVVTNVKRAAKPFGMGACRYVYHGLIMGTDEHVVLKENKHDTNYKRYLENYHAHLTAVVYAEKFNREKPARAETIQFVSPSLLEIKEGSKWRRFCVEPYIEGDYVKFSNNAGYVAKSSKINEGINDAMQAFSHYTWHKSGGRLLVCDLQGVVTKDGVLLTDPSVHSRSEDLLRYGPTNLGADGIKSFLLHHKCNSICTEMKLRPYS